MPDATFYGSVEGADVYHTARGNAAWTDVASSPDVKTPALVRATQFIDGRYRSRLPGRRADGRNQSLEWPRKDAIDAAGDAVRNDEVPVEIEQATYEAALRELTTPGSLSPDVTETARVKRIRKKVGDLEKETEFADSTGVGASVPVLTAIDDLLSSLLRAGGGSGMIFMDRA